MKRSPYVFTFLVVSLVGIVILFFGVSKDFLPEPLKGIETVLQGFGGAILGIGLSNLVGLIRSFDFFSDVNDTLVAYHGNEIKSDKKLLKQFKGEKFYGYHTSKTHDQLGGCWIYQQTEFFEGKTNTLEGKGCIKINEDVYEYTCEAGVRGKQLIAVWEPKDGKEGTGVAIFPDACSGGKKNTLYGIAIGESFTGEVVLRACVYSRTPLLSQEEPGVISQQDWSKLDEKWRKGFKLAFLLPQNKKSD